MSPGNSPAEPARTVRAGSPGAARGPALVAGIGQLRQRFNRPDTSSSWLTTIAGLVVFTVIVLFFPYAGIPAQYITLAVTAFIYSIVASGIALLYRDGGLLSIAHGGLWGVGAYVAAKFATEYNWQLVPIVLVAALLAGLIGTSLASISIRVAGSYFIIILFAVSEVIYGVMINWNSLTNGSEGIVMANPASLFGLQISSDLDWYYVTFVTLVVVILVIQVVKRSLLGRHLRAIRDSRELAMSVGISVPRVHMATFAITGGIAGIGGVYWGYLEKYVVPSQYSANSSITFVVAVLLGGIGIFGPVVGAIVVIFLPQLLHMPALLAEATIGAIFIVVILIFPEGVSGLVSRGARALARLTRHGPGPAGPPAGPGEVLAPAAGTEQGMETV